MNKYFIVILCFISSLSFSQKVFNGDPDKAFKMAREMAFNNQRKQAQDTLLLILTKYPDYHDLRLFLANTYSWDGSYGMAKKEFEYILKQDPNRLNTWIAAITNELRSKAPLSVIEMVKKGLNYFPRNPDILYLKASAEEALNNKEEALRTVEEILKSHPDHKKSITYRTILNDGLMKNMIGVKASLELYSEVFDPMQYYLFNYVRDTKYGSIHGRLNVSNRFSETGAQFEVDLYPKIRKGLYAYLNFGLSNSFLYPEIRYGAELYQSLPKSFEASLGFRALKYSETTVIYTGSAGWYTGNSYWSLRSYVTPGDAGTSVSGALNYRRYKSDANNYFSVVVGLGFSPDIYRFDFEGNEDAIVNLQSQNLNIGYYFTSSTNKTLWGIDAGVTHQEISFNPGSYLWIYSLGASWNMKFR